MPTDPTASKAPQVAAPAWPTLLFAGLLWLGLFGMARSEWSANDQYSYGWGVPLLGLYLVLRRLPPAHGEPAAAPGANGALPILAGLGFLLLPSRVLYEANPEWRLPLWAVGLTATAVTFMLLHRLAGMAWVKHFGIPVLFLLTAVPWPHWMESTLVQGLLSLVTGITAEALNWMGMAAYQQGNVLTLASGQTVGVDEACSGVRSFQSTFMIAIFVGELFRLKPSRRIGLLLAGLAWAILLNISRTTLLAWITARHGTKAEESWHDPAGYAVFLLAVVSVWLAGAWLAPRPEPAVADSGAGPVRPIRWLPKGFALALCSWLVAVEAINELWYRSHEPNWNEAITWTVKWPSPNAGFLKQPLPKRIQDQLQSSRSESGLWRRTDGSAWIMFLNLWQAGDNWFKAKTHRPDSCLPSTGFRQVAELPPMVFNAHGLAMPFRVYVFEKDGQTWHVFFCLMEDRVFQQRTRDLSESPTRMLRVRVALKGYRNLGQQAFEVAMTGYQTTEQARRAFETALPELIAITPNPPPK